MRSLCLSLHTAPLGHSLNAGQGKATANGIPYKLVAF